MNQTQRHALERIEWATKQIERLVPQERQRKAASRRHALEKAYQVIRIHGHKLCLTVPQLAILYDPDDYLTKTRLVVDQLQNHRKAMEGQKGGEEL